jgi:hypothetical protein
VDNKTVTTVGSNGIGFGGALFIVFLILKLTGYINWSWWWVAAPLWIPTALVVGILLIFALIALVAIVISGRSK